MAIKYNDRYGSPITSASCSGTIYLDNSFFRNVNFYFTGSEEFSGSFVVDEVGDYRASVTCSASSYSDSKDTETFSISAIPVSVSVHSVKLTGNFGDQVNTEITVSPSTTTCTSNYGTLTKIYSTKYSLSVPLDFINSKSVRISCSAPEYLSNSKTILVESNKLDTQLQVQINPETIYSFQLFSLYPNFYDVYGRPVEDASCSVTSEVSSTNVKSFQGVVSTANAGPSDMELMIVCSKFGYEQSIENLKLRIDPIYLSGELQFPDKIKQEEKFDFFVTLNPRISANCSINGDIKLRTGVISKRINNERNFNGQGNFELQLNESGTFNFEVECSSIGYSVFKETGEIEITLLSNSEEIKATLILTVMTVILAVGFILVRKWL